MNIGDDLFVGIKFLILDGAHSSFVALVHPSLSHQSVILVPSFFCLFLNVHSNVLALLSVHFFRRCAGFVLWGDSCWNLLLDSCLWWHRCCCILGQPKGHPVRLVRSGLTAVVQKNGKHSCARN